MENKWIAQSYIFADLLLKEILDQRCEPDSGFYLPGLAVANSELLQVLTPHLKDAHASEELQSGWNELLRAMMSDDVYENGSRLQKLRWLYRLDGIWLLAVVLAFVHRSDPKYQKAVAVLQENAESRGVDFFVVKAIARYLKIADDEDAARLMSDCREKEDLFERREDTLLILQMLFCLPGEWMYSVSGSDGL